MGGRLVEATIHVREDADDTVLENDAEVDGRLLRRRLAGALDVPEPSLGLWRDVSVRNALDPSRLLTCAETREFSSPSSRAS